MFHNKLEFYIWQKDFKKFTAEIWNYCYLIVLTGTPNIPYLFYINFVYYTRHLKKMEKNYAVLCSFSFVTKKKKQIEYKLFGIY